MKLSVEGPIATIVLDRPGEGNLVSASLAAELREVCAALAADDATRVVILTGNGPVFSVGRANLRDRLSIREQQVAAALGLTRTELATLAENSFAAAFD